MPALLANAGQRQDVLRDLVRSGEPTTTAFVRAAAPEAIANDLDLRWAALETILADAQAPAADVHALRAVVSSQPCGDHTIAAFAAGGRLQLAVSLEDYEGPDLVAHGWPRAVPLLRWEQRIVPAVVAVVGHGGASVTGFDDDGHEVAEEEIVGADDEIERNFPGGWSQPRYQRRAEDSWRHNARQFAEHVTRLARRLDAGVVVLSGDHREALLVRDALPAELRGLAVTDVAAHPTAQGSRRVSREDRMAAVRAAARRRLQQQLTAFDEAVSQHRAVEGPADVRRALDQGQARELFVVHGVAAEELADALVASALDADTAITVADPEDIALVGGVGAMLRFP